MNNTALTGLILLLLMLVGCAGTQTSVSENYMHNAGDSFEIEIVNNAGATEAALQVFQSQHATYYAAEFTHYYVRHGATRVRAGIFAGSDNATTLTTVSNAVTGKPLGSVRLMTKNPTAVVGINSLIRGHVDKIVRLLLAKERLVVHLTFVC